MKRHTIIWFTVCTVVLILSGCATRLPEAVIATGPGFFAGLWHGVIAPLTVPLQFFVSEVSVFAVPNNGGWYSLGFCFGISIFITGPVAQFEKHLDAKRNAKPIPLGDLIAIRVHSTGGFSSVDYSTVETTKGYFVVLGMVAEVAKGSPVTEIFGSLYITREDGKFYRYKMIK